MQVRFHWVSCPYFLNPNNVLQTFLRMMSEMRIENTIPCINSMNVEITDRHLDQERSHTMSKLKGKVAVVTGASKGIGAAIAKQLAADGASVVVNYSSDKTGAEKTVAEIVKSGGKAIAVGASVAEAAGIATLFAEAKKAYGTVDILVNNAGVYKFAPLEGITEEDYELMYGINVKGLLFTTKAAVAQFPATGGTVINIGSVASEQAPVMSSIYSSTKGSVDIITRVLARELGPKGIRVNAVNPGPVETEGFKSTGVQGSDFEKAMLAATPLGRIGQPDDIGTVVSFLASDEARWITGSLLQVAGGLR
jgi:3-oxoacyl-[acyl-carrier protein] reductase